MRLSGSTTTQLLLLALMTVACKPWITDAEFDDRADVDGDGYLPEELDGDDCDNSDAAVHPGATEWCDEVDNDCDGNLVPCVGRLEDGSVINGENPGDSFGERLYAVDDGDDSTLLVGTPQQANGSGAIYAFKLDVLGEYEVSDALGVIRGSADSGLGEAMMVVPSPSGIFAGRPGAEDVRVLPIPTGEANDSVTQPPPIVGVLTDLDGLVDNANGFGGTVAPFSMNAPTLVFGAPRASLGGGSARGAVFGFGGDPPNFTSPSHTIAGVPQTPLNGPVLSIDLDGTPSADIVVGSPASDSVLVFRNPGTGATSDDADLVLRGPQGSDFGFFVSRVDFDDDGQDDLLVSARGLDGDTAAVGGIFIFLQATLNQQVATLSTDDADLTIVGSVGGESLHNAAVGDVNGDLEMDLVVGAPDALDGAGSVFFFAGPVVDGSTADATARWDGLAVGTGTDDEGDELGSQVIVAFADEGGHHLPVVSAPGVNGSDGSDVGAVYVLVPPPVE